MNGKGEQAAQERRSKRSRTQEGGGLAIKRGQEENAPTTQGDVDLRVRRKMAKEAPL